MNIYVKEKWRENVCLLRQRTVRDCDVLTSVSVMEVSERTASVAWATGLSTALAASVSFSVKLAFHDADTNTDILARMSVSVSWNASFTKQCNTVLLKFHGNSFPRNILVTSSRRCPQQVVRVGLVDFGERHDTRTNGQHYTAADRRPTNQVSTWQTGRKSRPKHPTCCGPLRGDVKKNCCRGI